MVGSIVFYWIVWVQTVGRLTVTAHPMHYRLHQPCDTRQYTHLAAWQAFYATRNALVAGCSAARGDIIPRVTFTDPEVAHVGLTEVEARARYGKDVVIARMDLDRFDRAICENDRRGFLKIVHRRGGTILEATMVAARAGEVITEFALAIRHGLTLSSLTDALHPYPTYATGVMQLAADTTAGALLSNPAGRLALRTARWLNDRDSSGKLAQAPAGVSVTRQRPT